MKRYTVDQSLALSIGDMTRSIYPAPGESIRGSYRWLNGIREIESQIMVDLDWTGDEPELWLFFSLQGEEDRTRWQRIGLIQTPVDRYHGMKWTMRCPGLDDEGCGRTCNKLYLPPEGDVFARRTCHDLTYRSCQTSHCRDRARELVAARLGIPPWKAQKALDVASGRGRKWTEVVGLEEERVA